MSTSQEEDNLQGETMVGVNSHFAVVTEEEILQTLTALFFKIYRLITDFVKANTIILFNLGG